MAKSISDVFDYASKNYLQGISNVIVRVLLATNHSKKPPGNSFFVAFGSFSLKYQVIRGGHEPGGSFPPTAEFVAIQNYPVYYSDRTYPDPGGGVVPDPFDPSRPESFTVTIGKNALGSYFAVFTQSTGASWGVPLTSEPMSGVAWGVVDNEFYTFGFDDPETQPIGPRNP